MKTNRRVFIKKMNWALVGMIGLLGFATCKKGEDSEDIENDDNSDKIETKEQGEGGEGGVLMYGTPYAEYTVKGAVVSKLTGKPIEGIRVVVPRVDHHQRSTPTFIPDLKIISREVNDTTYTKADGVFEFKYNGIQTNDSTNVIMKFEDDAKKFKADSAKITFFESDLKGGSGWFQGSASKEVVIELNNQ